MFKKKVLFKIIIMVISDKRDLKSNVYIFTDYFNS